MFNPHLVDVVKLLEFFDAVVEVENSSSESQLTPAASNFYNLAILLPVLEKMILALKICLPT